MVRRRTPTTEATEFTARMLSKLQESMIHAEQVDPLGLELINRTQTQKLVGQNKFAIKIPYWDIHGSKTNFCRVRFLEYDSFVIKPQRYSQPKNSGAHLYFTPGRFTFTDSEGTELAQTWDQIADNPKRPLIITEGEFKAMCACFNNLPTIGLGGVWSWKSQRLLKPLLPEFYKIKWLGRMVYIIFDSDLATNENVMQALCALARELETLGAAVSMLFLPDVIVGGKTGLDDYIVRRGAESLRELMKNSSTPITAVLELSNFNKECAWVSSIQRIMELNTGTLMPRKEAETHFSNRSCPTAKMKNGRLLVQTEPLFPQWLSFPGRLNYNTITYEPGKDKIIETSIGNKTALNYNAWTGWGTTPKKGNIAPWSTLMDSWFPEKEHRTWFEQWLAYPLQHPGTKMTTAVVVWSPKQGTGKSLVGYTMREIYGRKNFSEIGQDDLHNNYTSWAENKQFIMGDEISGYDKRRDIDKLKQFITQETLMVKKKYIPEYEVPFCANFYFTSNHANAIFIERNDRRFFVHQIETELGSDWFINVYDKWLYRENGAAHLHHYLLNLNLDGVHHKAPAMITDSKIEMIEDNSNALTAFVDNLFAQREEFNREHKFAKDLMIYTSSQLFACFESSATHNQHNWYNVNSMGRALTQAGFKRKVLRINQDELHRVVIHPDYITANKLNLRNKRTDKAQMKRLRLAAVLNPVLAPAKPSKPSKIR